VRLELFDRLRFGFHTVFGSVKNDALS